MYRARASTLARDTDLLDQICEADPKRKDGWKELCEAGTASVVAALESAGREQDPYGYRARPGADLAHEGARYATDYLLIDSYELGHAGGTGRPLDPAAAAGLPAGRLFVAGGLRPETVAGVVARLRPFAVDVASGVEDRPGRKDHGKIEAFIRAAKAA